MPSGQDIQSALRRFVARWRDYTGSERSEAQTFLNELFTSYGTDRHASGARFEDSQASAGIMDLYWAGNCIIEMKASSRATKLAEHPRPGVGLLARVHRRPARPESGPVDRRLRLDATGAGDAISGRARLVRNLVRPERETNARKARRERWWQFGEKAVGMREALKGLARYVAAGRVGKRLNLAWQNASVCPSDLTYVFAFDDDYSMGLLLSRAHGAWAQARDSTFETRLRDTPTSGFGTFPWPFPTTEGQRESVAAASVALLARRQEICRDRQVGLTTLYNDVGEGAHNDLAALHRKLDEAVAACYGWPKGVAQDDGALVGRLLELNAEIVAGDRSYDPFGER